MLARGFFQGDPIRCAEQLVGTELIWEKCAGLVVETEAYLVAGDEACHTFMRPSTRAFVDRNKPGAAYIYFNYGVHWMLNFLVKGGPRDGLIRVRAIEPTRGLALMRKRRGREELRQLCSGPGKLTQRSRSISAITNSIWRRIRTTVFAPGPKAMSRSSPIRASALAGQRISPGVSR